MMNKDSAIGTVVSCDTMAQTGNRPVLKPSGIISRRVLGSKKFLKPIFGDAV